MKTRIMLLIVLMIGICGCSYSSQPESESGEEVIIVDDIEIPAALGEPLLSDQDLDNLKSASDSDKQSKISTYADAVIFSQNYLTKNNKGIINDICSYINDDYDDVKIINVFSDNSLYYLLGIKTNEKYYLLDPYSSIHHTKELLYDIKADSCSFPSVESLIESLKGTYSDLNDYIFTTDVGKDLDLDIKSNELFYSYLDTKFPLALGLPQLSEEEITSIDESNAKEMLTNVADYYSYVKKVHNVDTPREMAKLAIDYLFGDYDEVGEIGVNFESGSDFISYVKANSKYYPLHLFGQYMGGDNLFYRDPSTECSFSNIQDMEKAVTELFSDPFRGQVINTEIASHPYFGSLTGPNGEKMDITEINGEKSYKYKDYFYLIEYGTPKLTDNNIEKLIDSANNGDYETIKNTIETIPDAVAFMKANGFKPSQRNSLISTSEYGGGDVGNILYYDDIFFYTISGVESLIVKIGQCTSTSTLFKYLLEDDYEEFGYVNMWCSSDKTSDGIDGHTINYFKDNGRYYLVSPAFYLADDGAWEVYEELWCGFENVEEMMQKLHDSSYPVGKHVMSLAYTYDGIYCIGSINGRGENCTVIVPEGSDVKVCIGRAYDFAKPKHQTSQDHIIGVQTK